MNPHFLFLSILPVVVYLGLVETGRARQAVVAAVSVAAIEWLALSVSIGGFEVFSFVSLLAFALLGWRTRATGDERYIKFQPVLFELVFAGALLFYHFALDRLLFAELLRDVVGFYDALAPFKRDYYILYTETFSKSLPFLLLIHAGITGYAALHTSTRMWFAVRVLGLYAMAAALFGVERVLQVTY